MKILTTSGKICYKITMEFMETSQPHQDNSPFGNEKRLKEYVNTEREAVDYSRIIADTTRILAIGETHSNEAMKHKVINNLKQFKTLGFTHLGVEFLGTDAQLILDEYQATGEKREELLELIKSFGYPPKVSGLYLQCIDQAKRVGLKIVGLDLPYEETQYKKEGLAEQFSEKLKKRDECMAQVTEDVLEEDELYKMVTLTGSLHADKEEHTMAGLLTQKGIAVVNVNLLAGDKQSSKYGIGADADKERYVSVSCAVS